MAAERLQKIIAAAGIASRRKAEELITQGRVTVNGQVVAELGAKADPQHDHIKVDGKLLRGAEHHVYLLLNKPKGYVTTVHDPEGRPTVMDLVKHVGERIYPVGRLDYGSEGLLLLTNDGELANYLTRAASHVPKTYLVKVSGVPGQEEIEKLRQGVRIGSRPGARGMQAVRTAPAQIRIVREAENPWYEVTLIEGKNRQIRRMFEEIGHHVEKIKRVRYGALTLDVEPGQFRELTAKEVATLRRPERTTHPGERRGFKASVRYLGKARPEHRREKKHGAKDGHGRSGTRGEMQETDRNERAARFDQRPRPARFERPGGGRSNDRREAQETGKSERKPRFERRQRPARFERPGGGRSNDRREEQETGRSERKPRFERRQRPAQFEKPEGRKRTQHKRRGPR
jgi:23S rRNA pseudouridine2605 synthase